ncbi:MAG TPA: HAD family hydrolase [Ktedonobacteraceae bacterium]|nr:HAD family hydrolase [Ktedonobacteraceae bacterium]
MNIAFDVDGTLIDAHDVPRESIIALLKTLASCQHVQVYLWSGSGLEYARYRMRTLGLEEYIKDVLPKQYNPGIHLTFDDQEVKLGQLNIQVSAE